MKFVPELSMDEAFAPVEATNEYEIDAGPFGRRLRALHGLNQQTLDKLRRDRIPDLLIFGYDAPDLDLNMLALVPHLESLYLHLEKPIDWTPLQRLTQIQKLTLIARGYAPQPLDFKTFKKLHTVRLTWHKQWVSVLSCRTIRGLSIEHSTGISELDVRQLSNIRELYLKECLGLRRVQCAPTQALSSLGIASCRSFESVNPSNSLRSLRFVELGGNSRFEIESLGKCQKLERLRMFGVGKVRSLHFLSNCHELEFLSMHFSTQIEDGDLSVLLELPKLKQVGFRRYKNYSHTLEEIKTRLRIKD